MNTNLHPVLATAPVTQEALPSDMEVWEPPFERWMRIADSLLGHVPGAYCDLYPVPHAFSRFSRS